ncbi:MAG: succinate dehydrogenase cytochrome b subunit [Planctomycetota bacterium]
MRTSTAVALRPSAAFLQATIGKKVVMATTGVILFGFVVGHLLGNLQIYLGAEKLNHYSEFLHANAGLLWVVRSVLLASVALHILTAVQLTLQRQRARPRAYRTRADLQATYASRTMMLSGPIIAAFVVYHLLHLTFGSLHPSFSAADVYHNVVAGFEQVPVALAYIVAMVLLGMHLGHGLYSMTQSIGLSNPSYVLKVKAGARLIAAAIVIGNISIPLSVLLGLVR